MSLGAKIRQLRYARGWSADHLARTAKISRTALYQIESGRTDLPHAATLRRIARALGVSAEQLMTARRGAEEPDPPVVPDPPAPQPATLDLAQEIEIERKFRILLRSPLRDAVVRIVVEAYRLLPEDPPDR
jgi:transcriptional regulator with XRE-family HTH domain